MRDNEDREENHHPNPIVAEPFYLQHANLSSDEDSRSSDFVSENDYHINSRPLSVVSEEDEESKLSEDSNNSGGPHDHTRFT